MNQGIEVLPESEDGPGALEFWAAYQEDVLGKKNYLGNGSGGIRLFKSEEAIKAFLSEHLSQAEIDRTIVHTVKGEFIVPEPEPVPALEPIEIKTLYPATLPPTAEDLLESIKQSRKRHKPKGGRP